MSCCSPLKNFLESLDTADPFWVLFNGVSDVAAGTGFVKFTNLRDFNCDYFTADAVAGTQVADQQVVAIDNVAIFTAEDPTV